MQTDVEAHEDAGGVERTVAELGADTEGKVVLGLCTWSLAMGETEVIGAATCDELG